ncbi:hypothetical protein KIPB_017091, partial [Kipferlia bialata]
WGLSSALSLANTVRDRFYPATDSATSATDTHATDTHGTSDRGGVRGGVRPVSQTLGLSLLLGRQCHTLYEQILQSNMCAAATYPLPLPPPHQTWPRQASHAAVLAAALNGSTAQ